MKNKPLLIAALFFVLMLTWACNAAPQATPTPAPPPKINQNNLAIGKRVRASEELADSPAAQAVDGKPNKVWNSGAFAPQWIEIDLGGPYVISSIRLHITQEPAGKTDHRLGGMLEKGAPVSLHKFSGNTQEGQVLEFTPPAGKVILQMLRVETTESPSWVAWKEIEIEGQLAQSGGLAPAAVEMILYPEGVFQLVYYQPGSLALFP
ncbi:MAG: discoidin domain-containing protein [Chloroflexota bacterium]